MTRTFVARLENAPADLAELAVERTDELLRELRTGTPRLAGDLPARLIATVDRLREGGAEAVLEPLESTTFELPAGAAYDALDLARLLDEADAHCARGELLTLERPAALVAYRWWQVTEIARQWQGFAPVPFA